MYADHPWYAAAVTKKPRIAASSHPGMANSEFLRDGDAAFHSIAFGDTAQIDTYPVMFESNSAFCTIENDEVVIDQRQFFCDRRFVRTQMLSA